MKSQKKKLKEIIKDIVVALFILGMVFYFPIGLIYAHYHNLSHHPPKIAESLTQEEEETFEKEFQIMLPSDMYISKAYYDSEHLIIRIGGTDSVSEILHHVIGLKYIEAEDKERTILSDLSYLLKSDHTPTYHNADNEQVYSVGLLLYYYNDKWDVTVNIEFFYNENNIIVAELSKRSIESDNHEEIYNIFKRREEAKYSSMQTWYSRFLVNSRDGKCST